MSEEEEKGAGAVLGEEKEDDVAGAMSGEMKRRWG